MILSMAAKKKTPVGKFSTVALRRSTRDALMAYCKKGNLKASGFVSDLVDAAISKRKS
jgi:hypothetical protein